jgi:hypothetical protein
MEFMRCVAWKAKKATSRSLADKISADGATSHSDEKTVISQVSLEFNEVVYP